MSQGSSTNPLGDKIAARILNGIFYADKWIAMPVVFASEKIDNVSVPEIEAVVLTMG